MDDFDPFMSFGNSPMTSQPVEKTQPQGGHETEDESDSIDNRQDEDKDAKNWYVYAMDKYETHVHSTLKDCYLTMISTLAIRFGLVQIYTTNSFNCLKVYTQAKEWYDSAYRFQHSLVQSYRDQMQSLEDELINLQRHEVDPWLIIELSWLVVSILRESPFSKFPTLLEFIDKTKDKIDLFY